MSLLRRSNDALKINPPTGLDFHLSTNGSDWLWAVTAIYAVSLLIVIGSAYFAKAGERIFHYLFTVTLFTGSVAYFTMASDLGWTGVETSTNEQGIRQVFYARYINWFVGWTPLIIALNLLSGVSWATIVYNVALSLIWVSTWLAGSLIPTTYKWGYFAFGTFAYLLLAVSLILTGTKSITRLSPSATSRKSNIKTHYQILSGWLVTLWFIYPIAWGVDEGNKISVTSGFIFYGILDVLTGPVLAFSVLALARYWDYKVLNLYFTQYGRVAVAEGVFPEGEKSAPAAAPEEPVVAPEQTV